jgi:hypothetical protein
MYRDRDTSRPYFAGTEAPLPIDLKNILFNILIVKGKFFNLCKECNIKCIKDMDIRNKKIHCVLLEW